MSQSAFRRALESGDVKALRGLWAQIAPHLPQPASDAEAEAVMHRTRTESAWLALSLRAWSHRWLTDRGIPSGLPDELRPKAERLYPVIVTSVGIAVHARQPYFQPAADEIRRAMEVAVEESYADGRTDPVFVAARMAEARAAKLKSLFG